MLEFRNIKFVYMAEGKIFSVTTDKTAKNKRVKLTVENEDGIISARIDSVTPIKLLRLSAEFGYDFKSISRIFLNGYQTWTESFEHTPAGKMRGIDHIPKPLQDKYVFSAYGDYGFTRYSTKRGAMHGFTYGYIRNYDSYDFIGSLNEDSGFTVIRTDCSEGKVMAFKECKDLEIESEYEGLRLYIGKGSEDGVFDKWFSLMGIKALTAPNITGYTSWYRHYQDINEEKLGADLEALNGGDIFQIDDGWQTAVGDWLSVDKQKFPEGMKVIADRIREKGYIPGIWMAPFVCEKDSVMFAEHPDWLLKDENGQPVKAGSNWSGQYALDTENEEFREHLRLVFDTAVNEWGYGLLKLDFLYAACILPRKNKTRGQLMAEAMEFLREISGDAMILGCGVPLASAFGRVEYCRIGTDVSLDWDDKPYMRLMHRERVSTRNTVMDSVFRRQLNGRAFGNDPDVYMLRDTENTMTEAQRRCLAEINALTGKVLFTSDNEDSYGEFQTKLKEEMLALRDAKIISAELNGREMILRIRQNGEIIIKTYDL